MNEEDILNGAAKFSEAIIKSFNEMSPMELPLGNDEDIRTQSGRITRMGLKWAAMGLRYFPSDLFEFCKGISGKEEGEKFEYKYGKIAGLDIYKRFIVLGLGHLESILASMGSSNYFGWGAPYMPHIEEIFGAIIYASNEVGKDKRLDVSVREFIDTFKFRLEKYGCMVEFNESDEKASIIFNLYWANSFVAESYMYKGMHEEPVCYFLCGVSHGIIDVFFSEMIEEVEEKYDIKMPYEMSCGYVKEISCKAQGRKFCTFEVSIEIGGGE